MKAVTKEEYCELINNGESTYIANLISKIKERISDGYFYIDIEYRPGYNHWKEILGEVFPFLSFTYTMVNYPPPGNNIIVKWELHEKA